MKITVTKPTEIEVARIKVSLPVDFEEEDIPNDFPLRQGDVWEAEIDLDTHTIIGWPQGRAAEMHMKICDGGTYTLLSPSGETVSIMKHEYVPLCIPGDDSDYVDLIINSDGVITNWRRDDFSDFFPKE